MSTFFKSFVSFFGNNGFNIDSIVILLQSPLTIAGIVSTMVYSFAHNFFGDPVTCHSSSNIPSKVFQDYCIVSPSILVPTGDFDPSPGAERHAHLIGPSFPQNGFISHQHLTYYQFVHFILAFQCLLCYFPKLFWSHYENNMITKLVTGLPKIIDTEAVQKASKNLAEYLFFSRADFGYLPFGFYFAHFIALLNVILQLGTMDFVFDNVFSSNGIYVNNVFQYLTENQEHRNDTFATTFPHVVKCSYNNFGVSGSLQTLDSLCILNLNPVFQKIYIILFYWLFVVFVLTLLWCIGALYTLVRSSTRRSSLLTNKLETHMIDNIFKNLTYWESVGLWFIIWNLKKNLDNRTYSLTITELSKLENEKTEK